MLLLRAFWLKKMTRKRWHYIKTLRLAYPVMLSQFGQVMTSMADSIMVGQIGTIPLAAATLANSIFIVVLIFGIGASFAISPLVAQADGEKNPQRVSQLLKHALILNLGLTFGLSALLFLFTFNIHHFGQVPEVATASVPYLHLLNFSFLPVMVFFTFKQFTEGLSSTKPAMIITLVGNAINIVFNYLLIYGKFGFPEMGLVGAGWATLISRVLMFVAMFALVLQSSVFSVYWKAIQWRGIQSKLVTQMAKIGVPTGLQMVFEVGAFAFSAMMIGWISAEAQAAHNIAINLASVSYMVASGVAAATTVRVANQLGRKDFRTLREAGKVSFFISAAIMIAFGLVFLIGRNTLPLMYIQEYEVVSIASTLLVIAVMFQLSDGLQAVALGALRGMQDVKIPTIITLLAYWAVAIPFGYVFGVRGNLGVEGIWYGLAIGLSISAVLLIWRFLKVTERY